VPVAGDDGVEVVRDPVQPRARAPRVRCRGWRQSSPWTSAVW